MKVFYLAIYIFAFTIQSCCQGQNDTPERYKNNFIVSNYIYQEHTTVLMDSIRFFINKKTSAYYPNENDSLTQIFIDTILYSPKKDRMAFFVITKNSNDKLLSKGNKDEFHYDSHCFISDLKGVNLFNIKWLSAYSLTRYSSKEESSKRIREIYFKEFKGGQGGIFGYNLDDVRFWDDLNVWKGNK